MVVLNKNYLLSIPTKRRETTQQDVSDYTSSPDVHLEAVSGEISNVRVSKFRPGEITGHGKIDEACVLNPM